ATGGRMAQHDTSGYFLGGEIRKQDASAFSLSALAGDYALGLSGRDAYNVHASLGAAFTLTSAGAIAASELDYLGSLNDSGRSSANGTMAAPSADGRATISLIGTIGTPVEGIAYVVSANEILWLSTQIFNYGAIHGRALRQTGRPFSSFNTLTQPATFYGELEGPASGVNAGGRVGTIVHGASAGTFTMAYSESSANAASDASGNFTFDVGDDGRASVTDPDTGATSTFYFVSSNQGFIVGSTLAMGEPASRKFFGTFEPQAGAPFSDATFAGDYVFGNEPLESVGGDVSTGVVHFDGAGHATVTVDSEAADGTL